MLVSCSLNAQLYWINGAGSWADPNHWSEESGSRTPAGRIPDAETDAIIDVNSGFRQGEELTIPPGTFDVKSMAFETGTPFVLRLAGVVGNNVTLNIYGDLRMEEAMVVTYDEPLRNSWNFRGNVEHNFATFGNDLQTVRFRDADAAYVQRDDLKASSSIQLYGGQWETRGNDVETDLLKFQDAGGSSNPLPKIFDANNSEVRVGEWDARLTYGSLTKVGDFTIFTRIFKGDPTQSGGPVSTYSEIYLLEQEDGIFGGSLIESNNFDCAGCSIDRLIIEDTGVTQLASKFTIQELLRIDNVGSTVYLNSGNSRLNEITLNGTVETPPTEGCNVRTIIKTRASDPCIVNRASGSLTVSDVVLEDIVAQGNADFFVSNGILQGASAGWELIDQPAGKDYFWRGRRDQASSNWNDVSNWTLASGNRVTCLPSQIDNVFITDDAESDLSIPAGYDAECRDFTWTNRRGRTLSLMGGAGGGSTNSTLRVAGNFTLNRSAVISAGVFDVIEFSGSTTQQIATAGVALPDIRFDGEIGTCELVDKLVCQNLSLQSGTLRTNGHTVSADTWLNATRRPKTMDLGDSKIIVAGTFRHSGAGHTGVTVLPGTSTIECAEFEHIDATLHDLRLTNTSATTLADAFDPFFGDELTLNRLMLAGTGAVKIEGSLEVEDIVFESDGATLELVPIFQPDLTVGGTILSQASPANPAVLRSSTSGDPIEVVKPESSLCITGPITLSDVRAVVDGITHVEDGVDGGNNEAIVFGDETGPNDLYWVAGTGNWNDARNWSNVPGGCPAGTDPATAEELIIDESGIRSTDEVITLPTAVTARNVTSSGHPRLVLNVVESLTVDNLTVTSGYLELTGNTATVNGTTTVDEGVFVADISGMLTDSLSTTRAGLIIVRPEATVTVNGQ